MPAAGVNAREQTPVGARPARGRGPPRALGDSRCAGAGAAYTHAASAAQTRMGSNPLFVLVDPSSQGLETLTLAFGRAGCRTVATSDPKAAPELARSSHAQLAVIAVRQPEWTAIDLISGLHIHPETKNLPVVALGP